MSEHHNIKSVDKIIRKYYNILIKYEICCYLNDTSYSSIVKNYNKHKQLLIDIMEINEL